MKQMPPDMKHIININLKVYSWQLTIRKVVQQNRFKW